MKLRWSATSREDRDQIFDYIKADSVNSAILVDQRIVAHARLLGEFPARGRPGRIADTRELVVQGTSHILVYRELPGIVRIIRVLHSAQSWPEAADD